MNGLVMDFIAPLIELEKLEDGLLVAMVTTFCLAGLTVAKGWAVCWPLPIYAGGALILALKTAGLLTTTCVKSEVLTLFYVS